MTSDGLQQAKDLMAKGGVHPRAIAVFAHSYGVLASGETGMLAETDLEPIAELPGSLTWTPIRRPPRPRWPRPRWSS